MNTGSLVTAEFSSRIPDPASERLFDLGAIRTSPSMDRASQVSDQTGQTQHDEGSHFPAGLQCALESCLAALNAKSKARTRRLKRSYAHAAQQIVLENEIQKMRLSYCTQRITEQYNTLATPDLNDTSTMEKLEFGLYAQARWDKLLKDQWHTRKELMRESKRTGSTEMLPPIEEKLFEAELRAAYSSTLSSISDIHLYDNLVAGQYLDVIRKLAFEKLRVMGANEFLKQYIKLFEIQTLQLTGALRIANGASARQKIAQTEAYARQETAYRNIQKENKRLTLQVEWKAEESGWMESAWRTAAKECDEAVRERDAAIHECDVLKAELEILRAEKGTAVAKATEERKQE